MTHGVLGRGRVEKVLEHAPVDLAVLRLGGSPRPRRVEDVCRSGATHGGSDSFSVLEVCDERRNALVDVLRATAQACHFPTVGEEPPHQIPSADTRDADNEGAPRSASLGVHRFRFTASGVARLPAGRATFVRP